jgi:hypothetical protein
MKAPTLLMASVMWQATPAPRVPDVARIVTASHPARSTPRSVRHPVRRTTARTTQRPTLRIVSGVGENGRASPLWLAMIRKRLTPAGYDSAASIVKSFTPAESAWVALIQSRQGAWTSMVPALVAIYEPIVPPAVVTVVLGNRGASDAFTHDAITIGFDLAEMQASYGNASLPASTDVMDRLFRHELMHVMQKPWLEAHPWPTTTPLERALLDVWAEGLGNYQSLSSRWTTSNGQRPEASVKTLIELEPRFVARLAALACATPENAEPLLHDLSSGPFAKKWGAVTPALWLESETAESKDALHQFVLAGPAGVWELANRHLPETLRPVLKEAQTAGVMCGQRTGNTKSR